MKTINKTRSTLTNVLNEKIDEIKIKGDIHEDYTATSCIKLKSQTYYHKWNKTINKDSIEGLLKKLNIGINIPSLYKSGVTFNNKSWSLENNIVNEEAKNEKDLLERAFSIGEAFVFFYVTGTTDCHCENFAFKDNCLYWLDTETLTAGYQFKNLKGMENNELNRFTDNDYNLSELLQTEKMNFAGNYTDFSLYSILCKDAVRNQLDIEQMWIAIENGIKKAINSISLKEKEMHEWVRNTEIEKCRIIIRATRIYDKIIESLHNTRNDIERDYMSKVWNDRLQSVCINNLSRGNKSKLRNIINRELESMLNGCIPFFHAYDINTNNFQRKYIANLASSRVKKMNETIMLGKVKEIVFNHIYNKESKVL